MAKKSTNQWSAHSILRNVKSGGWQAFPARSAIAALAQAREHFEDAKHFLESEKVVLHQIMARAARNNVIKGIAPGRVLPIKSDTGSWLLFDSVHAWFRGQIEKFFKADRENDSASLASAGRVFIAKNNVLKRMQVVAFPALLAAAFVAVVLTSICFLGVAGELSQRQIALAAATNLFPFRAA